MTKRTVAEQLEEIRRWRDTVTGRNLITEIRWELLNYLLLHYDANRQIPHYRPTTTPVDRAEILFSDPINLDVLRGVLRDLRQAEAIIENRQGACNRANRWMPLNKPSASGKAQWVCIDCGRITTTPDKVCQ